MNDRSEIERVRELQGKANALSKDLSKGLPWGDLPLVGDALIDSAFGVFLHMHYGNDDCHKQASDEFNAALRRFAGRYNVSIDAVGKRKRRRGSKTSKQFVTEALLDCPDGLSVAALGELSGFDRKTLNATLKQEVERGSLAREKNEEGLYIYRHTPKIALQRKG